MQNFRRLTLHWIDTQGGGEEANCYQDTNSWSHVLLIALLWELCSAIPVFELEDQFKVDAQKSLHQHDPRCIKSF